MMIRKQWKKRLINGGILTGVFLAAVVFFSYLTNNGNDSMTAVSYTHLTLPTN